MDHPKMYDDDDPYLAELRSICLALPEAVEKESWGRPTFRAGKLFAIFSPIGEEKPHCVLFRTAPDEHLALSQDPRFSAPPYYDPSQWIALDLSTDVSWDEVAELVETSYRQVAIKRMLATLDGRQG